MHTKRLIGLLAAMGALILAGCFHPAPKTGIRADKRAENLATYIQQETDTARDIWQKPQEVIEALKIKPGSNVADVGAGAGYFTWRLADAVGKEGFVYATETNHELLTLLIKKSTEGGYPQVKVVPAQPEDPLLTYGSVDLALVCNNLSRIDYIYAFFDILRRSIKPGGRLAIIDWDMKSTTGPDPALRRKPEEVKRIVEGMGFRLVKKYDFLPNQYFMIFALEERYE